MTSSAHEVTLEKHYLFSHRVKVSEKVNENHHVACGEGKQESHYVREGKESENLWFGEVVNPFSCVGERESGYPYGVNEEEDLSSLEVGVRVGPVFREEGCLFFGEEGEKVDEGIRIDHEVVMVNGYDGMAGLDCRNEQNGDVEEENGIVNAHDHDHDGDLGSAFWVHLYHGIPAFQAKEEAASRPYSGQYCGGHDRPVPSLSSDGPPLSSSDVHVPFFLPPI